MDQFRKNKLYFVIILNILLFLCIGCEIRFNPNETLYITPYGTICIEDDEWATSYLLSVPDDKLYFLGSFSKVDAGENLISYGISEDLSKFYFLAGNSHARWKPYGTGLFVYDLKEYQNNIYSYSILIKNAIKPVIEVTNKDIIGVSILNDSITYTERAGGAQTTIFFDSL